MELQRALDAAHVLREWNTLKEEGIITDDEYPKSRPTSSMRAGTMPKHMPST